MAVRENFAIFGLDLLKTQPDADRCTIHFLSGNDRAILLSALRYVDYLNTRWFVDNPSELGIFTDIERDEIEELLTNAKVGIILACDATDVTTALRMIAAVLAGEAVTFEDDLPASVDYTSTGISPIMEEIRDLLAGMATEADDIEEILDGIGVILGAAQILP